MRYQGVFLLSVRKYLGHFNGSDLWECQKHVVGIKEEENGLIRDFKTGEIYDFVRRNNDRCINLSRSKAVEGNIYAIEMIEQPFDENQTYSARKIESMIEKSCIFTEEYKRSKRAKSKMLIK